MDFPHAVLARFYEHIEPIDRGDRYEDPLQAVLEPAGIGRVTGGGSQLNDHGGIAFADVEIELANLDDALRVVVEALEHAGAPQGSELMDLADERVLRQFGTQQCMAIFLDGTTLPDEVHANLDFDAVVAEIGDVQFVRSIDGDADWCVEFAVGLSLLPPGEQMRNRRFGVVRPRAIRLN